ncbi:MAG: ATP-binding cassette domain-containing protein [Bacteroidales bacterium]|jgi:ABC-2 type transport system ATP-binding protein|nr:ATP-binding cassette domain-containing protein [Bacteroidales bacterium]MDD4217360.1 ATP-binding cassette domain-containing protein [Bacteroidales bacterium]MDY0141262.1 ATP-binding cassette domain-containing protein [Bacteroidales bacterium]
MNTLIAENIVKKFSNHLALDNVTIEVPKGSIYGLLGPNGAGKTTLIRIINQITAPDTGQVWFNGKKLSSKHIAQIGYLPEERGLYKKMSVGEQSLYLCQLKGMSKKDALTGLKYWFEKFEIQAWWDKKVEELSKGMQQKVQFITTVLHKPELLIFDEPFSGFDPINANTIKNEIQELNRKGATIIFSTHNMSSVEELCSHIALINKSKKILEGDINMVREQHSAPIYELEYDGFFNKLETTLTSDYKILELNESKTGGNLTVEVLNDQMTSNDLLKRMMQHGTISSFRKNLPSMNDIFIKVVGDTNSVTE